MSFKVLAFGNAGQPVELEAQTDREHYIDVDSSTDVDAKIAAALATAEAFATAAVAAALATLARNSQFFTINALVTNAGAQVVNYMTVGGAVLTAPASGSSFYTATKRRLKSAQFFASDNNVTGPTVAWDVLKNGVPTAIGTTWAPAEIGEKTVSADVDLAAGDYIQVQVTIPAGAVVNQIIHGTVVLSFDPITPP